MISTARRLAEATLIVLSTGGAPEIALPTSHAAPREIGTRDRYTAWRSELTVNLNHPQNGEQNREAFVTKGHQRAAAIQLKFMQLDESFLWGRGDVDIYINALGSFVDGLKPVAEEYEFIARASKRDDVFPTKITNHDLQQVRDHSVEMARILRAIEVYRQTSEGRDKEDHLRGLSSLLSELRGESTRFRVEGR